MATWVVQSPAVRIITYTRCLIKHYIWQDSDKRKVGIANKEIGTQVISLLNTSPKKKTLITWIWVICCVAYDWLCHWCLVFRFATCVWNFSLADFSILFYYVELGRDSAWDLWLGLWLVLGFLICIWFYYQFESKSQGQAQPNSMCINGGVSLFSFSSGFLMFSFLMMWWCWLCECKHCVSGNIIAIDSEKNPNSLVFIIAKSKCQVLIHFLLWEHL